MDDRRHAVPAASRAKARRLRPDGILGRLTYAPIAPGEEIGEMRRNRAHGDVPHFRQVTPFTLWCAPAISSAPQPGDLRPWEMVRSQSNFLLENFPEAAIIDDSVESLLLHEIVASQPHMKRQTPPSHSPSMLAVGEITDLRNPDLPTKGHPVLAAASGIAGNVLCLISLAREECTWTDPDIKVRQYAPHPQIEGVWSQSEVPITLIRFPVDLKKGDPIRWLIVQNGNSTTVYEPELRSIPIATGYGSTVTQVFANPLFTIPSDATGGAMHCDACVMRDPETDVPMLAVIDQLGHWSIFEIKGRRSARPKILTPVSIMRGNCLMGSISKHPAMRIPKDPVPHRVLFMTAEVRNRGGSKAMSKAKSEKSEKSVFEEKHRRPILLLCNPQALSLFNTATGKFYVASHVVLAKDTQRILAVEPSKIDPSQAFILTTTSVLWVAVKDSRKQGLTLEVLVSCAHQKDANDPTLRLDVSPAAYLGGTKACFVCVRSARESEVTVFWFIYPQSGLPARYHRSVIQLRGPPGVVWVHIHPLGRRVGLEEPASETGLALRRAQLRFFQIMTLGHDLDIHSTLCAWSDDAGISVPPPDHKEILDDSGTHRHKLLQTLTSAFVVPDGFDERFVFQQKKELQVPSSPHNNKAVERQSPVDLSFVAERLLSTGSRDEAMYEDHSMAEEVDFSFISEVIQRGSEEGYMPRQSLLDLAVSHLPGDLFQLAREWDIQREAIQRRTGERHFVPEARPPIIHFGPDDLLERLQEMFPESSNSGQSATREKVLQDMAAELYFASIGISAVPEAWTAPPGKLLSSQPFPSSPTLLFSQPSLFSPTKISSSWKGKAKATSDDSLEEQPQGDTVVLRLRKYATINTSDTANGEPELNLSRWDLGVDPDKITWRPGQDLEAEAALERRISKREARRRKAERLSQAILGRDSFGGRLSTSSQILPSSQQPIIIPTSQPSIVSSQRLPPWGDMAAASQPVLGAYGSPIRMRAGSPLRKEYRPPRDSLGSEFGSQSQSQLQSQDTPSQQVRSQVLTGIFGGRRQSSPFKRVVSPLRRPRLPPSPLKQPKRKSDIRLSGFR